MDRAARLVADDPHWTYLGNGAREGLSLKEILLDGRVILHGGDSRDVLKTFSDSSIDAFVTDPPYALVSIQKRFGKPGSAPAKGNDAYMRASSGFMSVNWDTGETAFSTEFWAECLRVLKPGGHVAAFSGTRTVHRMACAIEDAGFEIRDNILEMLDSSKPGSDFLESLNDEQRSAFIRLMDDSTFTGLLGWAYGSGFPKSHDVSKGIDRTLGAERAKVRIDASQARNPKATGAGRDGMKGASRPWIESAMARGFHEAVSDEAVSDEAVEWQGWGTALKPAWEPIVLARKPLAGTVAANVLKFGTGAINIAGCRVGVDGGTSKSTTTSVGSYLNAQAGAPIDAGRWPANIIHDNSAEVVAAFPDSDGQQFALKGGEDSGNDIYGKYGPKLAHEPRNDSGSAARFFYGSKADADDRLGSKHPTIKNVDQIQWLCRLVTPKGGTICDPFAGSGTCGEAAFREGFNAVLIEREPEYQADIRRRMALCMAGPEERKRESIKAKFGDVPFEAGSLFALPDTPPRRLGKYSGHKSKFFVGPPDERSDQSE